MPNIALRSSYIIFLIILSILCGWNYYIIMRDGPNEHLLQKTNVPTSGDSAANQSQRGGAQGYRESSW